MSKKKVLIFAIVLCLAAALLITASRNRTKINPEIAALLQKADQISEALGDEYQRTAEGLVINEISYSYKDGSVINFHSYLVVFYQEELSDSERMEIVCSMNRLFDPKDAETTQNCLVDDGNATIYTVENRSYLCWKDTPNRYYAIDYPTGVFDDSDIIRMAESLEPVENNGK